MKNELERKYTANSLFYDMRFDPELYSQVLANNYVVKTNIDKILEENSIAFLFRRLYHSPQYPREKVIQNIQKDNPKYASQQEVFHGMQFSFLRPGKKNNKVTSNVKCYYAPKQMNKLSVQQMQEGRSVLDFDSLNFFDKALFLKNEKK